MWPVPGTVHSGISLPFPKVSAQEPGKIWDRGFQPCWLTQPEACTELLLQAFCQRLAPRRPPSFLGHVQYPKAHLLKSLFSNYVQCWVPGVLWETKFFWTQLKTRVSCKELCGQMHREQEGRGMSKETISSFGLWFLSSTGNMLSIRKFHCSQAFFNFSSFCISCTEDREGLTGVRNAVPYDAGLCVHLNKGVEDRRSTVVLVSPVGFLFMWIKPWLQFWSYMGSSLRRPSLWKKWTSVLWDRNRIWIGQRVVVALVINMLSYGRYNAAKEMKEICYLCCWVYAYIVLDWCLCHERQSSGLSSFMGSVLLDVGCCVDGQWQLWIIQVIWGNILEVVRRAEYSGYFFYSFRR